MYNVLANNKQLTMFSFARDFQMSRISPQLGFIQEKTREGDAHGKCFISGRRSKNKQILLINFFGSCLSVKMLIFRRGCPSACTLSQQKRGKDPIKGIPRQNEERTPRQSDGGH